MSRLRLIILVGWVLMFGAGFAAGRFLDADQKSPDSTYLQRLATQYDLRPEQVEEIGQLLDAEGASIDEILGQVEEQVRAQIQTARSETQARIAERLDPDQRERFDRDRSGG